MTAAAFGNRNTAIRISNAEDNFAEQIRRISGCDAATSVRVTRYYLKHRLAKLDAVGGRISVKHGAYLDPQAIARAIEITSDVSAFLVTKR